MVGVEEGRDFRFRGDLYSQQSTFPLVKYVTFDTISVLEEKNEILTTIVTRIWRLYSQP